jgi:hypothetical protein
MRAARHAEATKLCRAGAADIEAARKIDTRSSRLCRYDVL